LQLGGPDWTFSQDSF